jgi:hypothetical protein
MTKRYQPNSAEHTPLPWEWQIHDHSMASLGNGHSPGYGTPLVLSVGPCDGCAERADPKEWKWGRCCTPSEADAALIVKAVNNHDALVRALKGIAEFCSGDVTTLGAISRLTAIRNTVLNVLAALEAKP